MPIQRTARGGKVLPPYRASTSKSYHRNQYDDIPPEPVKRPTAAELFPDIKPIDEYSAMVKYYKDKCIEFIKEDIQHGKMKILSYEDRKYEDKIDFRNYREYISYKALVNYCIDILEERERELQQTETSQQPPTEAVEKHTAESTTPNPAKKKSSKPKNKPDIPVLPASPPDDATIQSPSEPLTAPEITEEAPPSAAENSKVEIKAKNIKIIIRGLSQDTKPDKISFELAKASIDVIRIVQFKRREGGAYRLLPLFLVIIPNISESHSIYDLKELEGRPIRVERFRGGSFRIQCFRCQGFGHTQTSCNGSPRCVKCSNEHLSFQCPKERTSPPKCANCSGPDTANYSGCEARPRRQRPSTRPTIKTSISAKPSKKRLIELMEELKILLTEPDIQTLFQTLLTKIATYLPFLTFPPAKPHFITSTLLIFYIIYDTSIHN